MAMTQAGAIRSFIAIELPECLRSELARLQLALDRETSGWRWSNPKQCHLTLAFLGDVSDSTFRQAGAALEEVARGTVPFRLGLQGLGAFPSASRPRVLWAGIGHDADGPLRAVRTALVAALARGGAHLSDDRFHPHVTLGRVRAASGPIRHLGPLIARHSGWLGGAFVVDELILFESRLMAGGPIYHPKARTTLSGTPID